jgi:hypothetical protein
MNAKHLVWCVMAASLAIPSVAHLSAEAQQHASHASNVKGPLAEAVREATRRFRDVKEALAVGYVQNGGCVSGPDQGAMGVHFANPALFDAELDVHNPEVLVYEPRNGRLHLVAAEYVVPGPEWDPIHDPFDKPHLMGHLLHFAPGPNRYGPIPFYELHVWAWKNNPPGTFADWNPNVSCAEWDGTF